MRLEEECATSHQSAVIIRLLLPLAGLCGTTQGRAGHRGEDLSPVPCFAKEAWWVVWAGANLGAISKGALLHFECRAAVRSKVERRRCPAIARRRPRVCTAESLSSLGQLSLFLSTLSSPRHRTCQVPTDAFRLRTPGPTGTAQGRFCFKGTRQWRLRGCCLPTGARLSYHHSAEEKNWFRVRLPACCTTATRCTFEQ